jgi:hypothetical protein
MILWLCGNSLLKSGPTKAIILSQLRNHGVTGSVTFNDLSIKTIGLQNYNPKKMIDKLTINKARENLDNDIRILKPNLVVINDEPTLRVITGQKYALGTVRGSLYFYHNIPCLVIDNFSLSRFRTSAKFEWEFDISKIARWATGKQHVEPAFDHVICKTVSEVSTEVAAAKTSTLIATDRETAGGFVTTTSYTYDLPNGKLRTFVVPFYDPWEGNEGAYWKTTEEEVVVHKLLADLHDCEVPKALSNGGYDSAYDIMYMKPLRNFLLDTQNLMHSIWCELPKSLDYVASLFEDHYTYWKDESKGHKEDGLGRNYDGYLRYLRYNGMDSYHTWLSATALLKRLIEFPWAVRNYNSEFRLNVGPCLAGSLRGLKVSKLRHQILCNQQSVRYEAGKKDMKELANEPDFNLNSPANVAWLLYDVLGAKPTRIQKKTSKYGPRSTDEKVLTLMKEQRNFFVDNAIDRLLEAKKPGGWLSKYGNYNELCFKNGRFLSWHNSSGTDTFRLNSGNGQFWTGTNGQNLQPFTQEMFVADDNYVFIDCDYSASDDWFIAHYAGDEDKINNLKTKDVHSYHASVFFNMPYEDVIRGKKNHEDWVVHPIKGVRQVCKKVAHGKNFRMGPETLFNTAGRELILTAAKFLGYQNVERLSDKELIGVCSVLGDMYDHPKKGLYKRIRAWQDESVVELKENKKLATNCFGITRWFLGSADDNETQRQLSSFYGQSGTSGNINRALNEIYYSGVDDGKTCLFLLQVHDSLKFLVHKSVLHAKVKAIREIMERPVTINGRTFVVPTNIEVGLTDGKRMVPYREDLTYQELREHETATYAKKFNSQVLQDQLDAMINVEDIILNNQLDQIENDQEEASDADILEPA